MKIPDQSVSALMKFGYTERESQFLYVVATFSGNFLRRQFSEFAGAARGGTDHDFLQKAIRNRHVREIPYKRSSYRRYHLCARSIYGAVDKENSSNRKESSDSRTILKLKILDFILDNFSEDYLEEEADKTHFFTEQRNISGDLLPAKVYENSQGTQATVRYFVDKFPLFVSNDSETAAIPVFTYFEDEYERVTSFAAHLNWYKPLLHAMNGQYKFIYVADSPNNFNRAEKQFQAVLSSPYHQMYSPALLTYFRLRKLWEEKKLSQLSDKDLADLNRAEKKFSRPEHEKLYQQWTSGDLLLPLSTSAPDSTEPGMFETYLLSA
jgi:hypothetical protein